MVTIPALFLAARLVDRGSLTTTLVTLALGLTAVTIAATLRSRLETFRQIVRESMPVPHRGAGALDARGHRVEKQLALFAALPALLVLQPAFVSSAGALGGILSSRLSTNLHLGLVETQVAPAARPGATRSWSC